MNTENREALVKYRIEKAEESLREAEYLAKGLFWTTCANRLYYLAFYAVSAILLLNGHTIFTHKGVKNLFNELFIKTRILGYEYTALYSELFDKRQKGDYADLINWKSEDILPLIEPTKDFIQTIKNLIETNT